MCLLAPLVTWFGSVDLGARQRTFGGYWGDDQEPEAPLKGLRSPLQVPSQLLQVLISSFTIALRSRKMAASEVTEPAIPTRGMP